MLGQGKVFISILNSIYSALSVPYTVLISTLKVLGHLIFKRIPPGNMTSDSRGLCRQEREIRSKFYTKRCSFITTFSPTEGSKLATA